MVVVKEELSYRCEKNIKEGRRSAGRKRVFVASKAR